VTEIRGDKALVRVPVREVCSHCSRCHRDEGFAVLEAEASGGLAKGDAVYVSQEPVRGMAPLLKALLFGAPAAALVAGIVVGRALKGPLPPDTLAGILGFTFFLAAFFAANGIYSRSTRTRCTASGALPPAER